MKIKLTYTSIIIFLLSFGLRYYYNYTVVFAPPLISNDAVDYYYSAKNLYDFGVYSKARTTDHPPSPDSFRPPLLPVTIMLAMAGVKSVNSNWFGYVILLQTVLGALTASLIYCIAIMAAIPAWGAIVIALLTIFDPCLVTISGYFLPGVYVSFFLLLFFYLLGCLRKNRNMFLVLLAAGAGALLFYSREEFLFVPIITGVLYFREWPRGYTALLLIFILLVTPWMIRKASLPESPSRLRVAAYQGSLPFLKQGSPDVKYYPAELPKYQKFNSMLKGWPEFFSVMYRRFKASPTKLLLWYLPQKSLYLLSFNFLQGCGNDIYIYQVLKSIWQLPIFKFLKTMSKYLFYFSIPLCILGLYRCVVDKNNALKGPAFVLIFYFAFFHLFVPLPKYMIPFRPIIYLFAMMYVSMLWSKLLEKRVLLTDRAKS